MNKQELIKKHEGKFTSIGMNLSTTIKFEELWDDILELDEPQKVVVPQFVADWIEYFKKYSGSLYGSTAPYSYYGHAITDDFVGDVKKTLEWIRNNSETYARAWLDGYEVEEEKRYIVRLKNIREDRETLNCEKRFKIWNFSSKEETTLFRTKHTRKELEEAGFGWVFDCEGIEIEEVE